MVHAAVRLLGPDGALMADQRALVAQRSHAFLFGCTGFEAIPLANGEIDGADRAAAEELCQHWFELFNFVTLPFYWANFEPRQGEPDTRRLLAAARWFRERGVPAKGHPLCWHTLAPPWLLEKSNAEIVAVQLARIRREVADFAGNIDAWDVVNEAVIMPVFDRYDNGITRISRELGRVEIVRRAFEAARLANPGAFLLINDFDLSEDYARLIEACLEAGVAIDAIGLQSHMHQGAWSIERLLSVLERYSRFGLPLHWTESTIVSGQLMPAEIVDLNDYQVEAWPSTPDGEERQAEEVVRHYRTLFADPAVAAVTWWGLPDGGWLKAPTGLVRADGSPKPAYDALLRLVKGEWWMAPTELMTDAAGQLRFSGFPGTYAVEAGAGTALVTLDRPGLVSLEARLVAAV